MNVSKTEAVILAVIKRASRALVSHSLLSLTPISITVVSIIGMAPIGRPRQVVSKEKFSLFFNTLKTTSYQEPNPVRGAPLSVVRTIAWNPLGTLIAAGSADKTLRVWNPDRPLARNSTELKGHTAAIERVAFNPSKEAELCSVSSDGVAKFWDVKSKTCTNEVKGLGDAFTLAWAPDGQTLVVGNKADKLFVLSPTEPEPISTVGPQAVQTNQFCFSWDSKVIFLTTGEGRVRILSYPLFEPIFHTPASVRSPPLSEFTLNGHTSACVSIAHHPQGQYLATGGSDSLINLWSTADWLCQRTLGSMVGPVRSISFSFDGSFIIGGSDEGNALEIAHTETGEYVHKVKTLSASPVVEWHPSRYMLAYADGGGLKIIGVDVERRSAY